MSSNPKSPYFVILKMATEYRPGHREALLLRLQGPAIASALQKNKQRVANEFVLSVRKFVSFFSKLFKGIQLNEFCLVRNLDSHIDGEYRPIVFENRVLRNIFGPKKDAGKRRPKKIA